MAKSAADLSVAELEQLLDKRKTKLGALTRQREKLQNELAGLEKQIGSLQGRSTASAGNQRLKVRKRPKNEKSLREHVAELLGRNKKGLSLADLTERILKGGYKTNSTNFKTVLYQHLYHSEDVMNDSKSGRYRLK